MQIRQKIEPSPISKVETDRREEVKNIKPIGSQKIPDSFETGKATSSDQQSNSSASAEPEKKAGQITGGILIKQMTQARLADSGIKLTNEVKENSGAKDFNDTEQGQADATTPQLNTKGNPRTPSATTDYGARVPEGAYTGDARSNMEKNKAAFQDFLNQHSIDVPSSGNGVDASDFGVGQGIDLGNGFDTQQGPGDPMDNVNEKFARMDYLNGVGNAANRLNSQMQDAAQGMDGANMGYGKDMVTETVAGELRDLGKLANEVATNVVKSDRLEKELDWQEKYADQMDKKANEVQVRSERIKTLEGQIDNAKKLGMVPLAYADQQKELDKLKKEQAAETKRPAGNSGSSGGTKTATDTTQENYDRGKVKQADELLKNLGMDGIWNLQRGPKDQGKGPDYGPDGGISKADGPPSLLSQFGKDGLVGQPNQQNHDGAGPSNFGGMPGATVTDPIEGDPYDGSTRDADVDVSVQTGMKQNVDDNDDEEKRKLIRNPDFKPATNYSQFKKH